MRTCPSTGAACYAEVCTTWPCQTPAERAAFMVEGEERAGRLRAEAQRAQKLPEEPTFAIEEEPNFVIEDDAESKDVGA